MPSEIVYVPAPVHHGRVENFGGRMARAHEMSRGAFNAMLAHLGTKSKVEVAALAAGGFFGSRAIAQYVSEAGYLQKVGLAEENNSYGRAGVCGIIAYALRNKQPIAAVGAGVAAVNEVLGPWVDGAIYNMAHPELASGTSGVSGNAGATAAGNLPPPS